MLSQTYGQKNSEQAQLSLFFNIYIIITIYITQYTYVVTLHS